MIKFLEMLDNILNYFDILRLWRGREFEMRIICGKYVITKVKD